MKPHVPPPEANDPEELKVTRAELNELRGLMLESVAMLKELKLHLMGSGTPPREPNIK